jgi:hypothetical protein
MKNKLVFGSGLAVGYVLGTRAGRQSYEQIRTKAQQLWNSPKVQDTVASTTGTLKSKVPEVQESLKGVLKKGGSGSKDDGATAPQTPGAAAAATGDLPLDVPPVVSALDDSAAGSAGTTGKLGPSGGDPLDIEETPFQGQDEDTRPDLGK